MKKRSTKEEIEQFVKEFYRAGLTRDEFASKHGMSKATLSVYLRNNKNLEPTKKKAAGQQGPYKPDNRKHAVETYLKSGLSRQDFADTWRVSVNTLRTWVKQYQTHGPKGLERSSFVENPKKRGNKGIPKQLKEEIIQTKTENPRFGIRKVRDFLVRFKGVKVSAGTINKTFKENNFETESAPKKRKRRSEEPRRFERANPMQLWQSDITSFNLPRSGQKVYLTVFLDDNARYIVGWNLQLRQTQDLVIDALLSGIERFGKPEEVLTDQGRQYFSWRGKCDFQKLLIKQGIRHVVARSHHPQTVGKCERLWETINVELLDRVRPQTLEEARERLTHFFNHYNHFRPHQGIDGMTPADRFFGVESEVRKVIEASITKNELRLAIGESPRSPVFLIGQIGDKPITMHGESGKLIVQTPDGEISNFDYESFGHGKGENNGRATEDEETGPKKGVQSSTQTSNTSTEFMGGSDSGTTRESSENGNSDNGILDRVNHEGRSGKTAECNRITNMADVTASNLGYASRITGAAQDEGERNSDGSERESEIVAEENCRTGSDHSQAGSADSSHQNDAGLQGCRTGTEEHSSRREECRQETEDSKQGTPGSSQ